VGPDRDKNANTLNPFLNAPFVRVCALTLFAGVTVFTYTILPRHIRSLGMDEDSVGLVMGAFFLGLLLGIRPGEAVMRRWGVRTLVSGGVLLMIASGALFMVAETSASLWAARLIQGFGWSGVVVGSISWITMLTPSERMAQGIGLHGLIFQLSQAGGPWLGEVAVDRSSFETMFVLGVGLTVLAALCAGFTPIAAATAPTSAGAKPVGKETWALRGATFSLAVGFGCVMSFLSDYVPVLGTQSVKGFFAAYAGVNIFVRVVYGALLDRGDRVTIIVAACVIQGVVLAGLAVISSPWQLVPLGALFGLAIALYLPVFQALMIDRIGDRGRAIATFQFWFLLGAGLASSVLGSVAVIAGYRVVFGLTTVTAGLAVVFLRSDQQTIKSVKSSMTSST
jgi:MFS family permease